MVLTEKQRASITDKLARSLGEEAETFMAHLDDVATKEFVHLDLAGVRSEIVDLRGHVDAGDAALRNEITGLRGEVRTEIGELRREMQGGDAALRNELVELRGEIKAESEALRTEIERGARRTIQWLVSAVIGSVAAGSALMGLAIAVLR